jgi:2-keto-4-pentenoate hydratase/2-oxohepta-3-ene-1,7-dioic acid hydratase in catechol pathway
VARLVSYRSTTGEIRSGLLRGDDIVDLSSATSGALPTSLLAVLETDGWERHVAAAGDAASVGTTAELELVAPMSRPPKLLACAANYQRHIDEGGGAKVDKTRIVPKLFLKPSSAIIGPSDAITLPTVTQEADWEIELAVVIGRKGFEIPEDRALEHVAGYMIVNDMSCRSMAWGPDPDGQPKENKEFFDWLNGKWPDGFAPCGPWIATKDEIPDPQALDFSLVLNGELMQTGNTSEMIFTCVELVAFASRFMTLEPGDIIATGTGAGCGFVTGRYLRDGDVMEASIDGLGTQVTPMRGR